MIKRDSVLAFVTALCLLPGCGNQVRRSYSDSVPDEMAKLLERKYSTSLHAVGTSRGPDESIAINKAAVQARAEIAREFKSQIEVLQRDYVEAMHDRSAGEYNQVLEIFSSLELSGSRIVKAMVHREKEDLYLAKVLVVVSAEQLKELIDQKLRDYTSFKATKAYKELQNRVERELSKKNTME